MLEKLFNWFLQLFKKSDKVQAQPVTRPIESVPIIDSPKEEARLVYDLTYSNILPSKARTQKINLFVVHAMSAIYADPPNKYGIKANVDILSGLKLSAHGIIDRDGNAFRLVEDDRIAYHAGVSEWKGKTNLNSTSIGWELLSVFEGKSALKEGFTDAQYNTLIKIGKEAMAKYGLKVEDFVAHADISGSRVRPQAPKTDPGPGFDWKRFKLGL